MSRRLRPLPGLALLLAACSLIGGGGEDEAGSSGEATGATGTPTTGDAVPCVDVGDCATAVLCEHAACLDGLCTYTLRAAEERDDDVAGDCRSFVCDGKGVGTPADDPSDVPADDNSCTLDQCDAAGQPVHEPLPVGTRCDGGYCQTDLSCQPCAERSECADDSAAEPNESQSNAHKLQNLNDDDNLAYLCETLGAPADVDWFTLEAFDLVRGQVEPALVGELAGLQVCMYFQCKSAGTAVTCPDGTTPTNAPLGQQGCCGVGGFAPGIDCDGVADATLWLQVRHAPDLPDPPPSCRAYQLGYAY